MSRKNDIFEKLDYADKKFDELADEIHQGGMKQTPVKFLSSLAGDVLASSREVFDYCANDIVGSYIAPNDADTAAKLSNGKLRCYYPFYKSQLTKGNAIFKKLKNINRPLHDHLFSIAASIEKKTVRPGTMLSYSLLKDMSDMVNQKKHDSLLRVDTSKGDTIYSESPNMKLMMNKNKQVGISYVTLPSDAKHATGDSYVFEFNKEDVLEFSMGCRILARKLMDEIYAKFSF